MVKKLKFFAAPSHSGKRLLFLLLVGGFSPFFSFGQISINPSNNLPYQYHADKIDINLDQDKIFYNNPTFNLNNAEMRGDFAIFDTKQNLLSLEGQIIFATQEILINAQKAILDIKKQTLIFEKAVFYDDNRLIFAKVDRIEKVNEEHYIMNNASVSQCLPEDRAWEFQSEKVDFYAENLAITRDVKFKVYRTNLFYLPVYVFPTTTQRKSGWLLPSFGYQAVSKAKGTDFKLLIPYFFNFSQEHDLTFTPWILSGRGLGMQLEYNYAFWEDQKASWNAFVLPEFFKKRNAADENEPETLKHPYPLRYHFDFSHVQSVYDQQFFIGREQNSDSLLYSDYFSSSPSPVFENFTQFTWLSSLDHGHFTIHWEKGDAFLYSSRFNKSIDPSFLQTYPQVTLEKAWSFYPQIPFTLNFKNEFTHFIRSDAQKSNLPTKQLQKTQTNQGYRNLFHLNFDWEIPLPFLDVNFKTGLHQYGFQQELQDTKVDSFRFISYDLTLSNAVFGVWQAEEQTKRKISFQPYLEGKIRTDTNQRDGLYLAQGQSFSKTQADYQLPNRYDRFDTLPVRKSLEAGLQFTSATSKKGFRAEEINAKLFTLYDFTVEERKKRNFLGPLIDATDHETDLKQSLLPLRLDLNVTFSSQLASKNFFRYNTFNNTFLEKVFELDYNQNDLNSASLTYTNRLVDYKDLDGALYPESDSLSFRRNFPLSQYWQTQLSGSWNFLRKKYNQLNASKPIPQLLTDLSASLIYLNCCYRIEFGYAESIQVLNTPQGTKEAPDKKVFFTLQLISSKLGRDFSIK